MPSKIDLNVRIINCFLESSKSNQLCTHAAQRSSRHHLLPCHRSKHVLPCIDRRFFGVADHVSELDHDFFDDIYLFTEQLSVTRLMIASSVLTMPLNCDAAHMAPSNFVFSPGSGRSLKFSAQEFSKDSAHFFSSLIERTLSNFSFRVFITFS